MFCQFILKLVLLFDFAVFLWRGTNKKSKNRTEKPPGSRGWTRLVPAPSYILGRGAGNLNFFQCCSTLAKPTKHPKKPIPNCLPSPWELLLWREGGSLSFQRSRVGQGVAGLRGALLPSHREILSTSHLPGGPWWDEVREGRHHTHQVCRSQSCSAPMGSCIPRWFHGWFLWPVSVTVLPTPVRCQRQPWPFTALIQGKGRGIHLLPCLSSLSYALMRPEMYILFCFQVALDVTSEKLCQNNWYGGRK